MVNRLETRFDTALFNTLWITLKKNPAGGYPNFALALLRDMQALVRAIKEGDGRWRHAGDAMPIHYAVLKSDDPSYFSVGGDLSHFRHCIGHRDREALHRYSRLCLDVVYDWAHSWAHGVTTIALVQGRALGGGFETALSTDFLISEEHSEFSFPEIKFGLFPCSGGMSFLARRVGAYQAERMMTDLRIYKAGELKEMGLVDEICLRGEGLLATERFIARHAARRPARQMLQRSRHRVAPLDYNEMLKIVDEWVETAMGLREDELKVLDMLVTMQRGAQQLAQQTA